MRRQLPALLSCALLLAACTRPTGAAPSLSGSASPSVVASSVSPSPTASASVRPSSAATSAATAVTKITRLNPFDTSGRPTVKVEDGGDKVSCEGTISLHAVTGGTLACGAPGDHTSACWPSPLRDFVYCVEPGYVGELTLTKRAAEITAVPAKPDARPVPLKIKLAGLGWCSYAHDKFQVHALDGDKLASWSCGPQHDQFIWGGAPEPSAHMVADVGPTSTLATRDVLIEEVVYMAATPSTSAGGSATVTWKVFNPEVEVRAARDIDALQVGPGFKAYLKQRVQPGDIARIARYSEAGYAISTVGSVGEDGQGVGGAMALWSKARGHWEELDAQSPSDCADLRARQVPVEVYKTFQSGSTVCFEGSTEARYTGPR